jgi:site-specific DNA recombinase
MSKDETPKRFHSDAVAYVRVSSKEQEKEGFSISAQRKLLQRYAEEQNIRILKVFEDIETAKQSGRAGFAEMLSFIDNDPANPESVLE